MFAKARFPIFFLCLLAAPLVLAEINISSSEKQVHLLELYTSEGCSSCPPADNWLSQLASHPALWTEIVPVAFHVDYWNYIGWYDRFSSPAYSARQRRYANVNNLTTVYTPGFLINGEEWRGFFKSQHLPINHSSRPGQLQVSIKNKAVDASFKPSNNEQSGKLLLNIAVLGFDIETRVRSGENRDRRLVHNFVVLGFKSIPLYQQQDLYRVMTELPDTIENAPRTGLAAWISKAGSPMPLQAAGGWLE